MRRNGVVTSDSARSVHYRLKWTRLPVLLKSKERNSMTVTYQPRKINNTMYDMPTVGGLDRCEINTKFTIST